jgi:hypothetical protein
MDGVTILRRLAAISFHPLLPPSTSFYLLLPSSTSFKASISPLPRWSLHCGRVHAARCGAPRASSRTAPRSSSRLLAPLRSRDLPPSHVRAPASHLCAAESSLYASSRLTPLSFLLLRRPAGRPLPVVLGESHVLAEGAALTAAAHPADRTHTTIRLICSTNLAQIHLAVPWPAAMPTEEDAPTRGEGRRMKTGAETGEQNRAPHHCKWRGSRVGWPQRKGGRGRHEEGCSPGQRRQRRRETPTRVGRRGRPARRGYFCTATGGGSPDKGDRDGPGHAAREAE